jgi:transcriptional regulator with XRE-family HTH domain
MPTSDRPDWHQRLRDAREDVHLTREELGDMAGVSPETIKSYELAQRQPSRGLLIALLDALKLERTSRNAILMQAGFAPDGWVLGPEGYPTYLFQLEDAIVYVQQRKWPAFVLNEALDVVGLNPICEKLWDIDFEREFLAPLDRNLLVVSSNPRFADKVNWDGMVSVAIGVFKGHHRGPEDVERPSPLFGEILSRFMEGDPRYVTRFFELWQSVPATEPKIRWSYPVVWTEPGLGVLRFESVVNQASEPDGLAFNDWIPLDARTWDALERVRGR